MVTTFWLGLKKTIPFQLSSSYIHLLARQLLLVFSLLVYCIGPSRWPRLLMKANIFIGRNCENSKSNWIFHHLTKRVLLFHHVSCLHVTNKEIISNLEKENSIFHRNREKLLPIILSWAVRNYVPLSLVVCSSKGGAGEVKQGMRSWKTQVILANNRYSTARRHLLTFYLSICSHLHLFHNPCIAGQPGLHRWVQKGLCSAGKTCMALLQTVITVDCYITYFNLWVEITPRDHFFTFPPLPGLQQFALSRHHLHLFAHTPRLGQEQSGLGSHMRTSSDGFVSVAYLDTYFHGEVEKGFFVTTNFWCNYYYSGMPCCLYCLFSAGKNSWWG